MLATNSLALQKTKNSLIAGGLQDFLSGFKLWQMCLYLGWEDIRQRYVRTFLGPLWLIIGTAVWVLAMGVVMASLFGNNVKDTLPFIAAGTLIWTFIANMMNDGCQVFIQSSNIIHTIHLPISLHVMRFLVRNFIIFLHNFVILIVVFLVCHVQLSMGTVMAIPGLFILLINGLWVGSLLGMINSRYRDIQQIITTSMAILPFVTPIFWEKSFLKKHFWIANANPFYHAVEIVRAPLLGRPFPVLSWEVMSGLTVFGILLTLVFFSKYKNRVIYWL